MGLMLGIDTGGTYTDAVLFDKENGIKSGAKSLTTKHDLTVGITGACNKVLEGQDASKITMVSLSSTLATNAIVEKHANPVCLIMIGFNEDALEKANLKSALDTDPCYFVTGGHNAAGEVKDQLDTDTIIKIVNDNKDKVSAFAVCSMFAVRNNEHELKVQELIEQHAGLPVTLSHSLASSLDAPRRALTALLNARLISQIDQLINAVKSYLNDNNIDAPLMIVQGNGSLMSADVATKKPVETIMSGPAASIVGASYLTGKDNVIVSDIGGTTTDVAMIKDGIAVLNPDGAVVHGWRTMVEAISVYTVGLGGDSEVRSVDGQMILGPRRTTPIALLATQYPYIKDILNTQLERELRRSYDGIFAHRIRNINENMTSLSVSEQFFWDSLEDGAKSLEELLENGRSPKPLDRLVNMGLVIYSAFSVSDASHILGLQDQWDREASILAGKIYALKERRPGIDWASDEKEFSELVIEQMTIQSSKVIIGSIYMDEQNVDVLSGENNIDEFLTGALSKNKDSMLSLDIKLDKPLVAIGAPAQTYYGNIAERLGAELIVPEYAYAANAVGAVVGKVIKNIAITISAPSDGIFRVHADTNKDFNDLESAVEFATNYGEEYVKVYISENNGYNATTTTDRKDSIVKGNGRDMFIQSVVSVRGVGEPLQK